MKTSHSPIAPRSLNKRPDERDQHIHTLTQQKNEMRCIQTLREEEKRTKKKKGNKMEEREREKKKRSAGI